MNPPWRRRSLESRAAVVLAERRLVQLRALKDLTRVVFSPVSLVDLWEGEEDLGAKKHLLALVEGAQVVPVQKSSSAQ